MNDFKKIVLLQLENKIIRDVTDVDAVDILIHLISKNVINPEEQRAVSGGKNKIAELIKILLSKTDGNWYEEFASALEKDFSWIARNLRTRFDKEVTEKLDFYLHGRGNVPPLPQHNIRREKYIQPLRDKIRNLKRNSYLVVHGLPGSGKTCLVVDALNDVGLLENSLNGCVYWMSVGDLRNEELDKIQCLQLQKKLCTMSNLAINPQRDLSPEELLLELKRHFSVKPNNASLLILDKVRCSKVIEILSVGCKILITSQDRDVVKDPHHRDFYEIYDGFSEQESVQLLSKFVLDGTRELAPPIRECATKIHRMWKGHPMFIRMIGGELSETKEDSQRDVARWQVYEKPAQHGTNGNVTRRRSAHEEQMKDIIELTTKKLKPDFKNRFFMLAVLVEDANITKEVLKILWDVESHEVEKTINTFHRRSLVLRKYVDKLKQPVYGIHDIIMLYLKKSVSRSDLTNMHKDLVKKIDKFSNGNFSALPEDSYIFSYLCHHVENANMWNMYRDQFFPLRYLERKLKVTGPGDLLLDLHKYKSGLENNSEYYCSKIKDIKSLVNDSGWDIHQGDVDIVQCALLQPVENYIHVEGTGIANSNKSKVYFCSTEKKGQKPRDLKGNFDHVQAVSLVASNSANLADGRLLIYPDPQDLIAEIDMHYKGKRRSFKEISHVVLLKMSPLRDKFLSALENGYINIWNMTSESTSAADTPPPSLKQKSHQPFFEDTRSTPCLSFKHKHRVICAAFSSDGRLIVSASADNVVCVWSIEKNDLLHELKLHPSPSATACAFVCNDTMIVYGCADFHLYFFELTHSKKFKTKIDGNYGRLVNLLTTQGEGRKLIVVQEKSVVLMSWELERLRHRVEGHREMELKNVRCETIYNAKSPAKITCAAYHQNHLVLGTSHNGLILFNVLSQQRSYQILASEEIKAVDIVNSQVVLAQNKSVIMLWPEPNKKLVVKQVESANLGWNTHQQKPLSVHGIATSDGNIQVFHDGKAIIDKLYPNTCFVRICEQSDHVLIGTSIGVVALLDTVSSSIRELFRLPSKITYLSVTMYENNYGRDYVYLASAKQTDNSEVLVLKVKIRSLIKECRIPAPVVKVFIHSQENCMIVILRDCSILALDLLRECGPTFVVGGRVSASITDASFSEEKSIIVLSDLENCFHQVQLKWPEKNKAAPFDSNSYNSLIIAKTLDTDVVDGMGLSSPLEMDIVHGVSDTIPRSSLSWCCSVSPKGELVAIGHGECSVLVWNLKTKSTVCDFEVLPDRRRKVGQLQFSHNNVQMGKDQFELVLCVVTDCVSFYDLSSILNDNSRIGKKDAPERIGCVTASGNDIVELSANSCFSKFCAFDISYSFFSWYVYEKICKDNVL